MRKRSKKQEKKLEFNEKLQIWSDRIGLIISIVLLIVAAVEVVFFLR